jgi:two-component system sensor histidine kinase QseC
LAVEDGGPGIPPDEMEMVRRRFFRGRHRSGFGTGLGLSIAELALRRAGAELRLRNRPGGGLRAEIVLEASRARPGGTAPHAADAAPGTQG